MAKAKTEVPLHVRLDKRQKAALEQEAWQRRTSLTGLIRSIADNFLTKHAKKAS